MQKSLIASHSTALPADRDDASYVVVADLIHICLLHIIGSPVDEARVHLFPHIHRTSRWVIRRSLLCN
jgi:hypothetical protein